MAKNNVVDLIVDIKLENQKNIKKYSKDLKDLEKVLKSISKLNLNQFNKSMSDAKKQIKTSKNEINGLTGANNKLKKSNDSLSKSFNNVKKSSKGAGDSLGNTKTNADSSSSSLGKLNIAAVAVAAGLTAIVNSSVQSNVELERQARLAGVSTQEFERWSAAARTLGVSNDELADTFNEIGLKAQDALQEQSGGFFDQLNKLNINIEEFTKLDPVSQFERLGDALQGLNEQEQKFALDEIASDAGIQSGVLLENINLVRDRIRQIQDLGGFVSPQQREELKKLNSEISIFSTLLGSTTTKAVSALTPLVHQLLDDFTSLLAEFNKVDSNTGLSGVSDAFIRIAGAGLAVVNALKTLSNIFETVAIDASASFQKVVAVIDLRIKQIEGFINNIPLAAASGFNNAIVVISDFFADILSSLTKGFSQFLSYFDIEINSDKILKSLDNVKEKYQDVFTIDTSASLKEQEKLNNDILKLEKEFAAKRNLIEANRRVEQDKQAKESLTDLQNFMEGLTATVNPVYSSKTNKGFASQIINENDVAEAEKTASNIVNRSFEVVEREIALQQAKISKIKLEFELDQISRAEFEKQIKLENDSLVALLKEQGGLTTNETERLQIKQQELLAIKQIDDLLKTQSKTSIKIRENEEKIFNEKVNLLKLQGQYIEAIDLTLKKQLDQINNDKSLTEEQRKLRIEYANSAAEIEKQEVIEKQLAQQKRETTKLEKERLDAAKKAADENKKRLEDELKALQKIQDLRLELKDLQGQDTTVESLNLQRERDLSNVSGNETQQAEQKTLINQVYDEKIIEQQFQNLLTRYLQLIEDFKNAGSGGEAAAIRKEIEATNTELTNLANENPQRIDQLTSATLSWKDSLNITDESLKNLANNLASGVTTALMDWADGTKDVGAAFQDMAYSIVQSLVEVQLQLLAMKALGLNSDGGFTGGGLFGLFGAQAGGSFLQFHEGGSLNDAMMQTRSIDSELLNNEMPAIVKKSEKIISNNEYNTLKGGNRGNINLNNNIVMNPADIITNVAKTDEWNETLISFMKANSNELKQIFS